MSHKKHTGQFGIDGQYLFNKREDHEYNHSFGFLAGGLGNEQYEKEKKRKSLLGTVDLPAPLLPLDTELVEIIEKTAKYVHKAQDSEVFERMVQERNKGKKGWTFIDGGEGKDYYAFCRHCVDREVEPHPLAEKARRDDDERLRREAEDKERRKKAMEAAAKAAERFAGAPQQFSDGSLIEVVGLGKRPELNNHIARVKSYNQSTERYEVRFEGGKHDSVVVNVKADNLMYATLCEQDLTKVKEKGLPEGEIPNGTRIEIHSLESEAARWLNGQKAVIMGWDMEGQRYEVRLDCNKHIKKVKPGNADVPTPEGWQKLWDEHMGKHYYLHTKDQKITWKHPTVTNHKARFGKVVEKNNEEMFQEGVEIDENRKNYDVDEEEELEGGFNLDDLVKKVEEQEERKLAGEDVDSDDGMHRVDQKKKKKKAKKVEITPQMLKEKVWKLRDETMAGGRATRLYDHSQETPAMVARRLEPLIERMEKGEESPDLLKETIEGMIVCLEKCTVLTADLVRSKYTFTALNKIIDNLQTMESMEKLLEDTKWVCSFTKTL